MASQRELILQQLSPWEDARVTAGVLVIGDPAGLYVCSEAATDDAWARHHSLEWHRTRHESGLIYPPGLHDTIVHGSSAPRVPVEIETAGAFSSIGDGHLACVVPIPTLDDPERIYHARAVGALMQANHEARTR